MKRILNIALLLINFSSLTAQNFEDLTFGTDSTFEVMTWNIEWFPKNGDITVNNVKNIIEALNVDVIAIQEVDDTIKFNQIADSLVDYTGYLKSSWFAGLAYLYNPDIIQINNIYEIYTSQPYWKIFPRSPMVMDMTFMNKRIILINNHFKCCGDGILDIDNQDDEETRRYNAVNLLKQYIDTNFANENVIVLGDLNDILTDDSENNVFQSIINDYENYYFTDSQIAKGSSSEWSYPSWPSHLDHILITNELFDELENDASVIQTIKIDKYISGGWSEYDKNISDHRPVAIKLLMNENVGVNDVQQTKTHLINYPNPFQSTTKFSFDASNGLQEIKIINLQGQNVFSKRISKGQSSISWDAKNFPDGIYFAKLLLNNNEIANTKLILIK
ncbi:MAG: endonuclease/exonuclease/phosphatase family protein [Bacteroidales bacterium]|nr:endonuclease/exonuclease/phosphatase family protein [Bacteroidales bacterium]